MLEKITIMLFNLSPFREEKVKDIFQGINFHIKTL